MRRFRNHLWPMTAILSLFTVGAMTRADDSLLPNWTVGGAFATRGTTQSLPPQYSSDGSKILFLQNLTAKPSGHKQGSVSVYNTIWQCIDRVTANATTIDAACFAADGTSLFYSAITPDQQSTTIWRHDFATKTEKSLTVREFSPITLMAVSPDGTYLAYYVPSTGKVSLYDFRTNKVTAQIAQATASLAFAGTSGKLVLSGPTLYDATGAKGLSVANTLNPVAVSPDGATLVTLNASSGKLTAYTASTMAVKWSKSIPAPYSAATPVITGEGRNVLLPGATKGSWSVLALSIFTGDTLSKSITSPQPLDTKGTLPSLAVSPTKNRLVLGPSTVPNSEDWAYDSTSGGGIRVGAFFNSAYSGFASVQSTTTAGDRASFALHDVANPANLWNVIDATTGVGLTTFSNDLRLSADLKFYAVFPYDGTVKIYSVAGDKLVASYTGPKANGFSWGSNSRSFWVSRVGTTQYAIDLFTFDGKQSITKTASVDVPSFKDAWLSPDASRLVVNFGNTAGVYNAATGASIGTISSSAKSGYGLHDFSFTTTGLVCVNEWILGTPSVSLCRAFDMRGTSLKSSFHLQRESLNWQSPDSFDATISPNGRYLAFFNLGSVSNGLDSRTSSLVEIVRAKDGAVVRRWKNQMTPTDSGFGAEILFSRDSSAVAWQSFDDGQVVSALVPRMLTAVTAAATSLPGGSSTVGTVTFDAAVVQDTTVSLSSATTGVTVPSKVVVRAGTKSATFPIATQGVDQDTLATVKATHEGLTLNLSVTVQAPSALVETLSPNPVEAGWDTGGIVTLNAATGPSGLIVRLTPSDATSVTIPTELAFPANTKAMGFAINTRPRKVVKTVSFDATAPGFSGSATLTINPTTPVQMTLSQTSVKGGQTVQLTLTLDNVAPGAGFPLKLSSNNPAAKPPSDVTITAATRSITVNVPTSAVTGPKLITIIVTSAGLNFGFVQLSLNP